MTDEYTSHIDKQSNTNIPYLDKDAGDIIVAEHLGRYIWEVEGIYQYGDKPCYKFAIADKQGKNLAPYLFAHEASAMQYISVGQYMRSA